MREMERILEIIEDKLYRHSYAYIDSKESFKKEVVEFIKNHEYFGKYELVIGESSSYQTRIDLIGKEIYSY